MLALILMWVAYSYFGLSVTGLFSPEYVDAPWSLAKCVEYAQPHLAAHGRASALRAPRA